MDSNKDQFYLATEKDLKELENIGINCPEDDLLAKINKIYSKIDITGDDILLTLSDNGQILSVNNLVEFWKLHTR